MRHTLFKRWIFALAIAAAAPAHSQATNTENFNPICGSGRTQGAGCDAIRARDIVDATQAPWRGIGRVNFSSIEIRSHCTGTLIAERIVLTAAHCLFNTDRKAWVPAPSVQFVAGYQRGDYSAVSKVRRYVLHADHDTTSRTFKNKIANDWALLVLEDPIGTAAGILATAATEPNADQGQNHVMAGYPRLRPHVLSVAQDCGVPEYDAAAQISLTRCAAMRGDSGGPLLAIDDGKAKVIAVTSQVRTDGVTTQLVSVPAVNWARALRELQQDLRAP